MLRLLALCLSVGSLLCAGAQTLNVAAANQVVEATHAKGDFDGVVIVSQHGKVLLAKAVGRADRKAGIAFVPGTVFRLASLTKQVTSLLVMQQVAAGKLRLDERAGDVLPTLAPTVARVTVLQLLQHISGLPNPSEGPENTIPAFYKQQSVRADYNSTTAAGFCSGKPVRDPDERFEYNNCDYIVLGALLEKVTGKPFAQLVHEAVIAPLGLKSWGLFTDNSVRPVTAKGYLESGKVDEPQNPATYGAAGALYGSALDVAKWDTALLTHKLLPAKETERMFHGENNLGGEALGSWSYDLPGASPKLHLVERQGDIGATRLLNLLLPEFDASIVILANTEKADLFNTYSKQGFGYALVKAATGR